MPRNIAIDDFMKIQLVSDPQFAPNGARIACVVRRIDTESNAYKTAVWVVPSDNGEPRCYTAAETSASNPRWSPDGTQLAFLSDRQKPKSQIYTLLTDGGEARPLTKLESEGSISGFRWSPDGSKIAFLFRATPADQSKEAKEEREKKKLSAPVRHHTRLSYRLDGFGYYDGEYTQVWLADVGTGVCTQLTTGDFDCGLPTWSPDSRTLAFLSDRRDDNDILPSNTDIYTVAIEKSSDEILGMTAAKSAANSDLHCIPSPPGPKHALVWSPDETHFAYIGNPDAHDPWGTNNDRLFILPTAGSETAIDLTGHTDTTVGYGTIGDVHDTGAGDTVQWNADGSALFYAVSSFGDVQLTFVETAGGNPVVVSPTVHELGGFTILPDGRAAVTLGSPTMPHELFVLHAPDAQHSSVRVVQRSQFNRELLSEVQIREPEAITVPNGEGGTVHGWLLKSDTITKDNKTEGVNVSGNNPSITQGAAKHPLVVYVHGGPHLQYGNTLFHELQWLAAEGYVVLYVNPRGSKGYGEAHTQAIRGDWGHADYRDVLAAADYACGLDYVDASRTAIMGGSYGGYMTAWAVGHTDRFTCAIADRLVGNLHSMAGTTDFVWRHGDYFKGDAWSDPADLWRCSPLAFAEKINTPLLIIHSDGDLRCPVGQAEELFAALRLQHKTVEYLRYPAETSHGLSRNGPPDMRLHRLRSNLGWLDRWLKV